MGAIASLTKWNPEDDLLLKNAVESGASLESLAKGAVSFSRRFTVRELQDRWHSLLYDLDTSADASARIIEIEIELSVLNPLKTNRTFDSNGKEFSYGKRKGDSVRNHYYSMRKRVCNEPCSSADLGFHVIPCTGSDSGCGQQLRPHPEHPAGVSALGAPISNHYGLPKTGFDSGQHVFPEMPMVVSTAASDDIASHAFCMGHMDNVEDELPDGRMGKDYVYGYPENGSPMSVDRVEGDNVDQSFDYAQKDIPHILGENLIACADCSDAQEIKLSQTFPVNNLYENDDMEAKPLPNDNHESLCSGFRGNDNLSSRVPECGGSFHQLGYSSQPPGVPNWQATEDISRPTGGQFEEKQHILNPSMTFSVDDVKKMDSPGCDGAMSDPKLDDGISDAGLNNSTIMLETDLDFSNPYLNFLDEELLCFDMDGNEIKDTSCLNVLNSLSLSPPSDTQPDVIPNSSSTKAAETLDTCLAVPDSACPGESVDLGDQINSSNNDGHKLCNLGIYVSSSSLKSTHPAEPHEGFISCTLNTEDLEIPCNDDVFLPIQILTGFPSDLEHNSEENTVSISSTTNSIINDGKATVRGLTVMNEKKETTVQPLVSSLKVGSSSLPVGGLVHSSDGCIVKSELFESDSFAGVCRHACGAFDDPNLCSSAPIALPSVPMPALKEESKTLDLGKHGNFDTSLNCFLDKPIQRSDHAEHYCLIVGDGCRPEADMQNTQEKGVLSHAELGLGEMGVLDPVTIVSNSDQEEQFSESENDVPKFSDVEAMILDMDLGPYDQKSCLFTREVSRYQRAETKKAIIRLEQGAYSYMQRAIASHRALAIFYGHRLKYYIKNPEVSLGRATEYMDVDIDLAREGPVNNISRRQAIIKMGEDGSFFINNTGRCSIFVNSKEVLLGQRLNLSSGCLIEIRGMNFIFEVNQSAVRHYITNALRENSHEQPTKFDWTS